MSSHGALIVVEAGPGIGTHVAAAFAQQGFRRVVLMSGDATKLSDDAMIIKSVAVSTVVDVFAVDLTSPDTLENVLEDVRRSLARTPPECVFINTGRSGTSKLLDWPVKCFQRDLQVSRPAFAGTEERSPSRCLCLQLSVVSLYTVIHWAMPQLLRLAHEGGFRPTLLATSSVLYSDPSSQQFSLAACRAAQWNILTQCTEEFGPRGVHCTLMNVENRSGDDSSTRIASNTAQEAWELFNQ